MHVLGFAKLGIILLDLASKGARRLRQAGRKSFLSFVYLFIPCMVFLLQAPMTSVTQKCFQDA